jgi:DNA-binding NtrC family response regulator
MKKQILVADEDQLILYGLAKSFKDDGCEVKTASTATAAIKKLSHCSYDLCLLDGHLADSNDQRLLKIIKDVCPHTKIIIMTTSYPDSPELSENINTAIAIGACHFIAKPFNLCDVTEVVHQVLAEADNFSTHFSYTDSRFTEKSRKHPRKRCIEKIPFQMSVIDNGVAARRSLEAQAVDISGSGIGLLSKYPLEKSQVIGFDEEMGNRTGVVIWSIMIDEENCRVGLEFV